MLFPRRKRVVMDIDSPEDLAERLTAMTWCGCNGFRLGSYLFLNDSTSPDGAQEYAVLYEPTMQQCESITFSWCSYEKALKYIKQTLRGEFEPWSSPTLPSCFPDVVQTPEEHGSCPHCA